jgi:hypothetical protein
MKKLKLIIEVNILLLEKKLMKDKTKIKENN